LSTESSKPISWAATKRAALAKCNGRCGYCGEVPDKPLQIDHIHPKCRAWSWTKKTGLSIDDLSNLMPACWRCNNYKHNMTLETFREEISLQVERLRNKSVNFRNAVRFQQVVVQESPIVFYFERMNNEGMGNNTNGQSG
jgi:5-methylcytosine-specific restriction endonuclease McrA